MSLHIIRSEIIRRFIYFIIWLCLINLSLNSKLYAATSTLEVGQVTLPATTNNTFTSFTFSTPFATGVTPNVFLMTTEDGSDPCTVRIRNVTNTGFDATCLEPESEDGSHPGMVVDYIAIVDGVTSVPVNGGGTVAFESGCLETNAQIYNTSVTGGGVPRCTNCSGPTSYVPQNFTSSFTNTPALLTQIQTTANLNPNTASDPVFIDTGVRNVDNTGFEVSNDQMEAGNGPLANDERICYLATAIDAVTPCKDLDLSSFSGPSSVMFQAINSGNVVDGWSNGCNAGEGVTFAGGCFTSTPVTLGKQLTRNGNNGGFLRRCSLSTSTALFTFDEDTVSDNDRSHIDEIASVFAFGSTFTTPVTLSSVNIEQQGRRLKFKWQTATETFHLGFHLWGKFKGEWVQLNKRLILGQGQDVLIPQDYQKTIWLRPERSQHISQFGISSIDTSGYEEFYGPFLSNQQYGELSIAQAIDWQSTRDAFNKKMRSRSYSLVNGKWRKLSKKRQAHLQAQQLGIADQTIHISTARTGLYRVSYEDIIQAGGDWHNTPIDQIALSLNGKALAREIISENKVFDDGDYIVFVGSHPDDLPNNIDAVYLNEYTYQLRINKRNVITATHFEHKPDDNHPPTSDAYVSKQLTSNKLHSPIMPIHDAWYDAQLATTGNAVQKDYNYSLLPGQRQQDGRLNIELFGGIDLPGSPPDHHVQVLFNGTLLNDQYFDGLTPYSTELAIPAGLLQGNNTVSIRVVGDTGKVADIIYIDEITASHKEALELVNYLDFPSVKQANHYQIKSSPNQDWQVYGYQTNGNLSKIHFDELDNGDIVFPALPQQDEITGIQYAIGQPQSWLSPSSIRLHTPQNLVDVEANLLLIAHPYFINGTLRDYTKHKEELGLNSVIVNWLDIVDTYGYGNNTPYALSHYLRLAAQTSSYDYVLLVGGHTYDYRGFSQQATINFIPSYYSQVGLFAKAPTDTPFVDLEQTGLPQKAIGRWPVRSPEDLSTIIEKSIQWQRNQAQQPQFDTLLIADQSDGRGLKFDDSMDFYVKKPLTTANLAGDIHQIYMNNIIANQQANPLQSAQQQIIERINQGVSLVSFNGHGSPSSWSRNGLFTANTIAQLNNPENPTIVLPLACYTTYYESLSINTLAHQWLFSPNKGAVAIHGAAVLGEYQENALFAERVLTNQLAQQSSLGQSILSVKEAMSPWNEMVNNWTLLGDPSLLMK